MAMPSVITSLALPPGVQQTAYDVLSGERGMQWARLREAAGCCAQHRAHVLQAETELDLTRQPGMELNQLVNNCSQL